LELGEGGGGCSRVSDCSKGKSGASHYAHRGNLLTATYSALTATYSALTATYSALRICSL